MSPYKLLFIAYTLWQWQRLQFAARTEWKD